MIYGHDLLHWSTGKLDHAWLGSVIPRHYCKYGINVLEVNQQHTHLLGLFLQLLIYLQCIESSLKSISYAGVNVSNDNMLGFVLFVAVESRIGVLVQADLQISLGYLR